jgi:iron complex transport system substrate-binding protein
VAALYWAHGFTSGKGTLANAIVTAAGLRNLGSELGLQGTAQVPLETLINSAPDIVVINENYSAPARATEVFRHPALRQAFADYRHLSIPANKWVCGTPVVADIITALHEAKSSINSASIGKQE